MSPDAALREEVARALFAADPATAGYNYDAEDDAGRGLYLRLADAALAVIEARSTVERAR